MIWTHAWELIKSGRISKAEVDRIIASYKSLAYYERIIAAIDDCVQARQVYLWAALMREWDLPAPAVFYWLELSKHDWQDIPSYRKANPSFRKVGLPALLAKGWLAVRYSKSGAILKITVTDKMPREIPHA